MAYVPGIQFIKYGVVYSEEIAEVNAELVSDLLT